MTFYMDNYRSCCFNTKCYILYFQLSYDLGTFYFYQEAYHPALEMFKETKDLLKHVSLVKIFSFTEFFPC